MKLTEHFDLSEMIHTNTGLLNVPNAIETENLKQLCVNVLEPLRVLFGQPIKVNSGFRSKSVNTKIKGAATSQHMKGEAADITSVNNSLLFKLIRDNFTFDQLIWEAGDDKQPAWVHVSYKQHGNRKEVLKMKNGKYFKM